MHSAHGRLPICERLCGVQPLIDHDSDVESCRRFAAIFPARIWHLSGGNLPFYGSAGLWHSCSGLLAAHTFLIVLSFGQVNVHM